MSLSTDIRRLLLSKSAITSLVGTRVYPSHVPQSNNIYPCLTYQVISTDSAHTLQNGAGYCGKRLQIDVYARTEVSRDQVAEAVRDQLQGFPATQSAGTIGAGTVVNSIVFKNARDVYEPDQTGGDVGYYRSIMEFWVRHQESVPSYAS